MKRAVRELQLAAMILTRVPVGRIEGDAPPIAGASWAFPVVGALVGALAGVVFWIAGATGLPQLVAALLAIAAAALVTGAFHEDGLADTADGFGGGTTVSRKLEIMRDSRIGSYGVLALILTTALTASAIADAGAFWMFLAIGAASRAAMLFPMTLLPPARSDGLGQSATTTLDQRVLIGFAIAGSAMLVAGTILVPVVMVLIALAVLVIAQRQIGGQTGDVLGATQKLTECGGWLTAAAIAS